MSVLAETASDVCALLQRAADGVVTAKVDGGAEMGRHIGLLSRAIAQASAGELPNLGTLPSYAPARRLLDALRSEFLDLALQPPQPTAGQLLSALRGIESVRSALEADAAQRLASRVSSPNALEAVVAVAHDMRSPLTSVLFLVDALRTGHSGPITPHQERQLLLVYGAVFALSSLASDLLDLARGGDRLFDHVPVPFSISECLHVVRDIVTPIAEEKKLEVILVAPEKGDRRVGQPTALARVLLNLTTNALKFTDQGSVTVAVTGVSRTLLEFSVSDTGRGIPPEVLDTLFDAFRQQSRSGETVFSSAGLGLSICQKLVSAMGGTLGVESVYGERTCFSFRLNLPLAPRI
jgi:signal transduction histidine kinase